jgi:hypothetical protein
MAMEVRRIARRTPRFLLLVALAWLPSAPPAHANPDRVGPALAHSDYPQVRLRKLHLVRPDLIPYPVEYDVYC